VDKRQLCYDNYCTVELSDSADQLSIWTRETFPGTSYKSKLALFSSPTSKLYNCAELSEVLSGSAGYPAQCDPGWRSGTVIYKYTPV